VRHQRLLRICALDDLGGVAALGAMFGRLSAATDNSARNMPSLRQEPRLDTRKMSAAAL
jgi:hypothetical protein